MPYRAKESSDKFELGYYDATHFKEDTIDSIVTVKDIEYVFNKLSNYEGYIPRIDFQNVPDDCCVMCLVLLILNVVIFTFGTLTLAIDTIDILYLPAIMIAILLLIIVLLIFTGIGSDSETLSKREEGFTQILRELNHSEFEQKGVRFVAGEYGAWIEMHLHEASEKLGSYHRDLKHRLEKEINDDLADELYLAGIPPIGYSNWHKF